MRAFALNRNRVFSMPEFEKALNPQGKLLSLVLLENGVVNAFSGPTNQRRAYGVRLANRLLAWAS